VAFDSVIGHDRAKGLLARALSLQRLPPATLLVGPDGVGKRTLALAVARAAICQAAGPAACESCSSCRRLAKAASSLPELRRHADQDPGEPVRRNYRLHPDVVLVEPWRTRVREDLKVEQVRDLVREISGPPFEARRRVFVVDGAHAMTEQAANALLKALEEPPATSHVMLVTASPQSLLPTIRSRCQMLRLGALPSTAIEAHLQGSLGVPVSEARLRARLSGGSLAQALAFESDAYRAQRDGLLALLESLPTMDMLQRLEAAESMRDSEDLSSALTALRGLLRDVAALRGGAEVGGLQNADVAPRLLAVAEGEMGTRAVELADAVGRTRTALRANANKLLALDLLMDSLALSQSRRAAPGARELRPEPGLC